MGKLKSKILNFSIKHAKQIMKYVPTPIVKFVENIVVNKNSYEFERVQKFDKNLKTGINFVGYLKAQSGLGQGSRLFCKSIRNSKYDFAAIDTKYGENKSYNETEFDDVLTTEFPYDINILHVQPHTNFEIALSQISIENLKGRYNIGYWLYELEDIPEKWHNSFKYVNEIWTPSEFVKNAFEKVSPVPVYCLPYGIQTKKNDALTRKDFGIPEDKFVYLCLYDPKSSVERKNPQAVIKAFKKAFKGNDENVFLVIKMIKGTQENIDELENELKEISNYKIINDLLPQDDLYSLISLCDVYVSLHRSEGFGLVMAEAMSLGTVCIATNYSANIDFMNKENSLLVDYKMVPVGIKNHYLYGEKDLWADADVEQASKYMMKLYEDKELYNKLKENAQKYIAEEFSIQASAKKIEKRIDEIIKENDL